MLLWARPWAYPHEVESFSTVVGILAPISERWKSVSTDEDLFAEKWAPISKAEAER